RVPPIDQRIAWDQAQVPGGQASGNEELPAALSVEVGATAWPQDRGFQRNEAVVPTAKMKPRCPAQFSPALHEPFGRCLSVWHGCGERIVAWRKGQKVARAAAQLVCELLDLGIVHLHSATSSPRRRHSSIRASSGIFANSL